MVDAQQAALGFQPVEQIGSDSASCTARELAGEVAEHPLGELRPGWIAARSNIQESRGLIHVSRCGAMPCRSSHRHASIAVLPAPTIT